MTQPLPTERGATRPRVVAILRGVWRVVVAIAVVAYPLAVYGGLTRWTPRTVALGLLVLLAPSLVSRLRRLDRGAVRSVAAVPLLTAALLGTAAALNAAGFVLAIPVVVNGALLASFAVTLRGPTPMIERFARLQEPDLRPEEVRWCRVWTRIWCGFFAINGGTALALALWAPLSWWTLYNGLVAYGLIGTLFAVEYVMRKLRFARFGDGWHDRLLSRLASPEARR